MNLKNHFYLRIFSFFFIFLSSFFDLICCDFKQEVPYSPYLNYGTKRIKPGIEIENEVIKNKVEVLGAILKKHVQKLRKVRSYSMYCIYILSRTKYFMQCIYCRTYIIT